MAALAQRRDLEAAGALHRLRVFRQHLVAVRDHGLQRLRIDLELRRVELHPGRGLAHRGEPQALEHADVHPAEVELVPADRELGGRRIGVVVVVQLLAADPRRHRSDVGARVLGDEVAVAPPVADAVDDTRGPEWNPGELHAVDEQPRNEAEERDVDRGEQHDAPFVHRGVDVALQPVVGRPVAVALHRLRLVGFLHIQHDAGEQHLVDAEHLRAVRIVLGLALRVVLAVDRGPLLGDHARGHPQPEAEEMAHDRVHVEGAVRLATVQVDGDACDGDLDQHQQGEQVAPPREVQHTAKHRDLAFLGSPWNTVRRLLDVGNGTRL